MLETLRRFAKACPLPGQDWEYLSRKNDVNEFFHWRSVIDKNALEKIRPDLLEQLKLRLVMTEEQYNERQRRSMIEPWAEMGR